MMQLANGNWALLAGNEQADSPEPVDDALIKWSSCGCYQYRLAGVVTGGRITERWCLIFR